MKSSGEFLFLAMLQYDSFLKTICYLLLFFSNIPLYSATFYEQLAFHYAPIHYQDVDDTNPQADYITRYDYDGNYDARDNWDHLFEGDLSGAVYYSVVESETHWFMLYTFFHPRDRAEGWRRTEHENDFEGLLLFVRKDETTYGQLEGMVTHAHGKLFTYLPQESTIMPKKKHKNCLLSTKNWEGFDHPITTQQARGHGCYAWPFVSHFQGASGQDGIIYYPSLTESDIPSLDTCCSRYQLIDFHQNKSLWTHQLVEASLPIYQRITFSKWGYIQGDKSGGCGDKFMVRCTQHNVRAPWVWNGGDIALDPAKLIHKLFHQLGDFSLCYLHNPYLEDLKNNKNFAVAKKSNGWPKLKNRKALFEKLNCSGSQ